MKSRITILGAGPGGYVAALEAARLGAEVTVIEKEGVGGTCLNHGCIPSKVLKNTADLLERFHQAEEFGLTGAVVPQVDMARLMARKEAVIADQAGGIEKLLQTRKVRYIRGTGRITGPGQAEAQTADGLVTVDWDRLIIATGSRPMDLPGLAVDGRYILSSNEALALRRLPESMLVVGAGVIGCEFAFIFSAMGVKVSLVEGLDRVLPLPSVDEESSKVILREMKKRKFGVYLDQTVASAEVVDGRVRVLLRVSPFSPNPKKDRIKPAGLDVEMVLVSVGRKPNTEGIGLETIGLATERGWIPADDRLSTSVPGVYAIGDVLGPQKVMLAHVASMEGRIAARNALGADEVMGYDVIPGAMFTMPEAADVGLTEAQARSRGIDVAVGLVHFRTVGKAQVIGETAGQAKIVADRASGRVLGVHLVGPHATDLIAEGVLAVQTGRTVEELARTIHAHPTLAEIMGETALAMLETEEAK
jgi:dihydrolipoamide dehydrogenase